MQRTSVYLLPDRLLIAPSCPTSAGVFLFSEPYAVLPLGVSALKLGEATEAALSLSERTIPHPTDWKASAALRLTAAGVKSEREFQVKAALVEVSKEAEGLRIVPSHNGGSKGEARGFSSLVKAEIMIQPNCTADRLGVEILGAFYQCTR